MNRWGYRGQWVDVSSEFGEVDFRAEDLRVGSIVRVRYCGAIYSVHVVPAVPENPKGFWRYVFQNKRHKSLSAIARLITGDKTMSGNRFFRLRRRR